MKKAVVISLLIFATILAVPFWLFVGKILFLEYSEPTLELKLDPIKEFEFSESIMIKSADVFYYNNREYNFNEASQLFAEIEARKENTRLNLFFNKDAPVGLGMEVQEKFKKLGFGEVRVTVFENVEDNQ